MNTTAELKTMQQPQAFPYATLDDLPLYDQRYLPRWLAEKTAYYRSDDTNIITKTSVKDLSFIGACLYATQDVHLSQELEVIIYLAPKVSFLTKARVMWKRSSNDHCYAGVVFDPLPQKTQDLILRYAFEG